MSDAGRGSFVFTMILTTPTNQNRAEDFARCPGQSIVCPQAQDKATVECYQRVRQSTRTQSGVATTTLSRHSPLAQHAALGA